MTQAVRTKALAAVAACSVLYAVVTTVQEPGATSTSREGGDAAPTGSAVVVLAGAPRDLGREALAERYRTIRSADPFKPRTFDPPPTRRAPERRPEPRLGERQPVSRPRDPDKLDLRLTGLLGHGDGRRAVLEETSGSGKGLLAQAGLSLGPVSIAAVGTESVTFSFDGEGTKHVKLGGSVELPIAVASRLEVLKVTSSDVAVVTTGASPSTGSAAAAPAVSAEDRQAILERLRERRRRSISGGGE